MSSVRASHAALFGAAALLFAASAVMTVMWSLSMSSMGEMPMPRGWSMSMTWMPTCGETWLGAAASFVGMWTVMMVAMMLPSLGPMLMRYREAIGAASETRLALHSALFASGYFLVWAACGLGIFIMGAALTSAEMRLPALAHGAPFAIGAVVLIAGATQFTTWKTRQLACCRTAPGSGGAICRNTDAPLRHGIHFGWRCVHCCAGLTATLVVIGVMDLRAMLLVTAAVTAERVAPGGPRIARVTGAILVAVGSMLIARAAHRI
ncbi:DUF2182 domain-containing protein [Paraburkholderia sp. NMBU_R16]|uniref:DUF2182 domain-containing protein n=1 Tax=Paraburkholderia sp. NMBU_R16 TaxID=2698676 RepID=UPI001562F18A|nr:DUF2182 domain-containing protein [Paraburkholderia sp. NMBU_R16]NRO99060.1 DUF2182 domain-containing protein [Paraburkholderia sp. NMBU_R16]